MKLILFWLCANSVSAITTPLWSIYANDNPHPQFYLYPSQQQQQFHNGFQYAQNSPTFGLQNPTLRRPLFQQPSRNIRFPQALNTQNFPQTLPYPTQPNFFYVRPHQNVLGYNPATIRPVKKPPKRKSKMSSKTKPKGHSFPVIYVDGDQLKNSVPSDHEVPQEIPTKPIYPGKGHWAKRGKPHRPHVTKHKFKDLEDSKEPDVGHEIFDEAKAQFEKQKYVKHFPQSGDYQDDYYEDTSTEEFVPYKTYAQVRHSESEEHLPFPPPEDERLKESITDSKTHTVYTEEGYDDSAYDHADREKNADDTEVYVNAKKKNVKPRKPKPEDIGKDYSKVDDNKSERITNSDHSNMDMVSVDQQINSRLETTTQGSSEKYGENGKVSSEVKLSEDHRRKRRMVSEDVRKSKSKPSTTYHNSEKYPYYNLKSLEENSPLRYSENLQNAPDKKPGVMAFYDQADKIECEEVEKDVDPIPSESETTSKPEDVAAPAPRLRKLGDKIDCFKAKYFGENPLDNPLFEEELIDAPRTLFEKPTSSKRTNSKRSPVKDEADEISRMIQGYVNYEVTENNEDILDNDDTMIERIKETVTEDSRKEKVSDIILGRYLREDPSPNLKYLDDAKKISDRSDSDDVPESSAYVMKRRRKPYRSNYRRTSLPPVIYSNGYKPPQATKRPFSEVHYKDEIKHSEQLNVFADVINNIKASTQDADAISSNLQSTTTVRSRPRRRKLPSRNFKVKTSTSLPFEVDTKNVLNNYGLTSSARPPLQYNYFSEDLRNYVNPIGESFSQVDSFKDKVELLRENEIARKPSNWSPMAKDEDISPVDTNGINGESFVPGNHRAVDVANRYEVHGLTPPRVPLSDSEATSNNFNVIGMRPPPTKSSKRRRSHLKKRRVPSNPYRLRIVKRSARRGYSEISRQSKDAEETPQEREEEEYVPHRPRTYHYDVEKGRIIYDKKPESEEEVHESYEYVDVVEEITQRAKPKKEKEKKEERVLKFPDKPPEGPTYIDFIKQLKSAENYHEIPDPKPTEKTTTVTPSTETPVSTTEPEFLSILAKVRGDSNYKTIEDEKKSKAKDKVAEAQEEASEIEEEEEALKDVQNSPGGQLNSFASSQLEIFDISEYMPKVKNYSPSTNVDTSKYKSIERVTITRHNSNSRYSSEDEGGEGGEVRNKNAATTSSQSLTLQAPTSTNTPTAPLPKTERPEIAEQSRRTTARGRRRPTTTQSPADETTEKPRRSRGRGRFRSTTSGPTEEIRESTRRRRNLQRKHVRNSIPRNHKSHYSAVEPDGSVPKAKEVVTTRTITADTLKETKTPLENATEGTVEIFKPFDKTQKHGGNYKYKKVEIRVRQGTNYVPPTAYEIEDSEEIKRLTDIVPKPFAFYSDPKLPSRINSLTEANNRDGAEEVFKDELQFFEDHVNSEPTTRKPNFIKDPSQRLYFYAPI